MKIFLESDRLILREFVDEDADSIIALDSDSDVMKYLTDGKPTDPDLIRNEFLPKIIQNYKITADFGFWAAVEKETNTFLGWFHFRESESPIKGIELGYRLNKSAWGKGYATEGSQALLKKGFEQLSLPLVFAKTLVENQASLNVMQKIGMKWISSFIETRFPGKNQSAVTYAVTQDEYFALHNS
jgi:RimJ/RimL family protein N-acetyltransferase